MEKQKVSELLNKSICCFKEKDLYLLEVDVNERSMTHKFAEYLQDEFKEWNVDCEYNRDGIDDPKRMIWFIGENSIKPDDDNAKTVFPDIIIHKRGPYGKNLIVIEAKKDTNKHVGKDDEKLKHLKSNFKYKYAISLIFETESKNIKFKFI